MKIQRVKNLEAVVKFAASQKGIKDPYEEIAQIGWKGKLRGETVGSWMQVPSKQIDEFARKLLEITLLKK